MWTMKLPDETPELDNFKWALEFGGLWWDQKNMTPKEKVVYILKVLNFTVFIVLLNVALAHIPLADIPFKPYAPLTFWYNTMYITVIFLTYKSNEVVLFRERMAKLMSKYRSDWETKRFVYLNTFVWKFALYFMTWSMCGIICLLLPGIIDILLSKFNENSEIFYIPFLMEGFLPEKKERSFQLYFFIFLSTFTQIVPLTYFVFFVVMLPAVVTYVYFALEVMQKNLQLWEKINHNDPTRRTVLREVIEDHVEVLRLLEIMKNVLAPMYCLQIMVWCFNFGYYAHFAKVALKKNDVALTITEVYLAISTSSGLFISNIIGQFIFDKGLEVSTTIYNLRWYEKSTGDQLDLQLLMLRAQKPVVISYKNTLPLNLYTLSDLLNKSYTLFVLLGIFQAE